MCKTVVGQSLLRNTLERGGSQLRRAARTLRRRRRHRTCLSRDWCWKLRFATAGMRAPRNITMMTAYDKTMTWTSCQRPTTTTKMARQARNKGTRTKQVITSTSQGVFWTWTLLFTLHRSYSQPLRVVFVLGWSSQPKWGICYQAATVGRLGLGLGLA